MDEFGEVRDILGFLVDAVTAVYVVYRGSRLVWKKLPQGTYGRDITVSLSDAALVSDSPSATVYIAGTASSR